MRASILLLACLTLAACGLRPLYGSGNSGSVAATLRTIEVAPIPGQSGWLVRNELVDRLGETPGGATHRLIITLDDDITAFGIRTDRAATRERRTLRARYQLVSVATGLVVLDATGHCPNLSAPEATIAAIESFLASTGG